MKNTDLAKKIKELRTRRAFSQEQLADAAQINLRTVQRIESGDTEPRGDTLQRLARALSVTANELIDWTEQEDNGFLITLNLSALSFIAYRVLGIVVPLALWFMKKDKIKNVNDNAKKLINFQITWCILLYLPTVFVFAARIFKLPIHVSLGFREIMLASVVSLTFYGYNVVLICMNGYRVHKGKKVWYGPSVPFLK